MSDLDNALDRFVSYLRVRLENGARTYGNASFERPIVELADEIQEELEDVCGWALILWTRIDRMRDRLEDPRDDEPDVGFPETRIRTWIQASDEDIQAGLLGYLSIEYGEFVLDGITVRRTAAGQLALSFPARTDRAGKRHARIRPSDDEARFRIEREILGELVCSGELEP